jgi:hypothetical protein
MALNDLHHADPDGSKTCKAKTQGGCGGHGITFG